MQDVRQVVRIAKSGLVLELVGVRLLPRISHSSCSTRSGLCAAAGLPTTYANSNFMAPDCLPSHSRSLANQHLDVFGRNAGEHDAANSRPAGRTDCRAHPGCWAGSAELVAHRFGFGCVGRVPASRVVSADVGFTPEARVLASGLGRGVPRAAPSSTEPTPPPPSPPTKPEGESSSPRGMAPSPPFPLLGACTPFPLVPAILVTRSPAQSAAGP